MFRPNKQNTPGTYRLPKMQAILGEGDLQFVLGEAASKRGTTIEMPFMTGADSFMLTVLMSTDSNEPVWTYFRGDDSRAEMIWRHPTGDVNLVLNLCASESGSADGYQSVARTQLLPHQSAPQAQPGNASYTDLRNVGSDSQSGNRPPLSSNQITSPGAGRTSTLEGNLSNMQIPTLLQSINMSKMTGKLCIEDKGQQASIYFVDGIPNHAITEESNGDLAIVEMITWEEGQFHFYPNEQSTENQ